MSIPNYSEQQLQEINHLEAEHGFPGLIVAGANPEIAATMTPFQRHHALDWLRIANARFGAELQSQLGRWPTVDELTERLALSLKMHAYATRQAAEPRH